MPEFIIEEDTLKAIRKNPEKFIRLAYGAKLTHQQIKFLSQASYFGKKVCFHFPRRAGMTHLRNQLKEIKKQMEDHQ